MPPVGTEGAKRRRPAQPDDDSGAGADGLPASPALGAVDGELAQPVTLLTEKWKLLPAFLKVRPNERRCGCSAQCSRLGQRENRWLDLLPGRRTDYVARPPPPTPRPCSRAASSSSTLTVLTTS
jgi:hypothetical protein